MGEIIDLFSDNSALASGLPEMSYEECVEDVIIADMRSIGDVSSTEADIETAQWLARIVQSRMKPQ